MIIRDLAASAALEQLTYRVTVQTGDVKGAGTDANVYLTMFGDKVLLSLRHFLICCTKGEHGPIRLDTAKDNFERGKLDVFHVDCKDLGLCSQIVHEMYINHSAGDIRKIKIGHDNSSPAAAWFLSRVIIQAEDTSKEWFFYSEQWYEGMGEEVVNLAQAFKN